MESTATIAKSTWVNTWYDWYEPYVEAFCAGTEMPTPEENSDEWWKAIDRMRMIEIDDFWTNLKYSRHNDRRCLVTGSVGLWNGSRQICPEFFDSLTDAVMACVKGADDYEVYTEDGEINVIACHHDGRNRFIVHVIKDGNDIEEDDEDIDVNAVSEQIEYLF